MVKSQQQTSNSDDDIPASSFRNFLDVDFCRCLCTALLRNHHFSILCGHLRSFRFPHHLPYRVSPRLQGESGGNLKSVAAHHCIGFVGQFKVQEFLLSADIFSVLVENYSCHRQLVEVPCACRKVCNKTLSHCSVHLTVYRQKGL